MNQRHENLTKFINDQERNKLPSFSSHFIKERCLKSCKAIQTFLTQIQEKDADIIQTLRDQISIVFSNIYNIYEHIWGCKITKDELFTYYLPKEFEKYILIENNPKKSNLIDSNSLADLKNMLEDCLEKNLILEKKVKNLHGILEDEVQKNKTLQKRVDDLMQTVDVLNQSASQNNIQNQINYARLNDQITQGTKMNKNKILCERPSPFDIVTIIRRALSNKNQAEGSKAKFLNTSFQYNSFCDENDTLNTLPLEAIRVLDQFAQKHAILLPSAIPFGHTTTDYSFDINNAIFHGPYGDDDRIQVEQQQTGMPQFYVKWSTNDDKHLDIEFFNHHGKSLYYFFVTSSYACLYDSCSGRIEYEITSDGNLGKRTV